MNTRWPRGVPRRDRVHPDAVAEQRAAALAPRRVDATTAMRSASSWSRRRRTARRSGALARAAGAGDAEHRRPARRAASDSRAAFSPGATLPFSSAVISCASARQFDSAWPWIASSAGARGREVAVAAHHHLADHALRGPCAGRPRAVDARDAVGLQLAISAGTMTPPPPPKTWMPAPPPLGAAGRPCT